MRCGGRWPERYRRVFIADRAFHRGMVGWTGERCPYGLRIRRGEVDWKGAEPRRELQGDGQDVSAHPGTDSAGKSFEIEGRQTVAHAQEPATRAAQRDESRLQEALTHAPFDFAGSVLLRGSEAGKVPSRPLSSSICNFLSDFTACSGSSACLSVGAGLNFSGMTFLVSRGQRCLSPVGSGLGNGRKPCLLSFLPEHGGPCASSSKISIRPHCSRICAVARHSGG